MYSGCISPIGVYWSGSFYGPRRTFLPGHKTRILTLDDPKDKHIYRKDKESNYLIRMHLSAKITACFSSSSSTTMKGLDVSGSSGR